MKMCYKCGVNPRMIVKNGKHAGKVQAYCYPCHWKMASPGAKRWYINNKEKSHAGARRRWHEKKDYIRSRKLHPCTDCKQSFHPCAMEFDHRDPTAKVHKLSSMSKYSLEFIIEEISKCDLVCSNCHHLREYSRKERKYYPKY